ncbi:MAG: ribosome maturation factor RimM [Candidatus Tectomicrobia bacterium]|nr:ribosome maturation factor RimM [Candidatus Tectomicrobia bacterium]
MQSEQLVAVGRFTRPHGVRGELVFLPYVADIELLPDLSDRKVRLRHGSAPPRTCRILKWRMIHSRVLMQLEGLRDPSEAEQLRDYEIVIPRGWFPALPCGEYYWFEIEGLAVFAGDGLAMGVVTDIIHTGSNDVYVVSQDGRETLVPALKDVVRTIDLERGAMHLHDLPG